MRQIHADAVVRVLSRLLLFVSVYVYVYVLWLFLWLRYVNGSVYVHV